MVVIEEMNGARLFSSSALRDDQLSERWYIMDGSIKGHVVWGAPYKSYMLACEMIVMIAYSIMIVIVGL